MLVRRFVTFVGYCTEAERRYTGCSHCTCNSVSNVSIGRQLRVIDKLCIPIKVKGLEAASSHGCQTVPDPTPGVCNS